MGKLTYIEKNDFVSPFPVLSKNILDSDIEVFIYKAMNESLSTIFGKELYNEIYKKFIDVKKIINVIVGNTTILTLNNVNSIEVNGYITIEEVQGTISPINKKQYKVLSIANNDIEVSFDSTGLVYTANSGEVNRILSSVNYLLIQQSKPYLIYNSYSKYLPYSNIKNTVSGAMVHNTGEASPPTDKTLGILSNFEVVSADFEERKIYDYLETNKTVYPLYQSKKNIQNTTNVLPIFSNGLRYDSGNIS